MSDIPENKGQPGKTSAGLADPNTQIASKLKALYSAVEQEAIPATFLDLLEKLDKAEQGGKS